MKRLFLTFIITGLLALNAFAAFQGRTYRFDVAVDKNTMAGVGLPPNGPPQRGNTFIILGKIFPSGTLLPGVQQNDPNAAGSIGDFFCRATFANDIPVGPGLPELLNTQMFRFSSSNQLISEGIESSEPSTVWTRSVTGGTGSFLGASGSESIRTIGTNATGGFNQQVTFRLVNRSDD